MTIHEPRSAAYGWRCTSLPGCRACGAGYGSERAAHNAEKRHNATHPTPAGSTR